MIKFKLKLVPEEGIVKPYIEPYGYIFRAIFMDWLKKIKPQLVHELHSYNKIRPYSIQLSYRKNEIVFYLNIFAPSIAEVLMNDLIRNKEKEFDISNQTFLLKKVVFEDYSLRTLFKRGRPVKKFKVSFIEPTFFNTTRSNNVVRLPIPEVMFSNILNLWNCLFNEKAHLNEEDFLNWVNRSIFLSSLDIRTDAKEIGEVVPTVGFIGWVKFKINENENDYAKFIDIFCKFGELSNIGSNRTAALGRITYKPIEYFSRKKT